MLRHVRGQEVMIEVGYRRRNDNPCRGNAECQE
jgi:hypothetical protein